MGGPAPGGGATDGTTGSVAPRPLILVVDDDPASLKLVRAVLTHEGYATLAASNGLEAVRGASTHQPDVAVLDISLPDIDGIEVLRRIRADPRTEGMPAVAVTAFAMPDDRDRLLGAGFDRHVPKPIDAELLLHELRALLETP